MAAYRSLSSSPLRGSLVSGLVVAICAVIVGAAPSTPPTSTGLASAIRSPATAGPSDVDVVELDLQGVDSTSKEELEAMSEAAPAPTIAVDPESSPGLTTADPLGVLPDAATPEVLTERLAVAPFSVMGVTWDLDAALDGLVVQYRTFREGAWADWEWAAASEEYVEVDGDAPSRGATDAIFVPDSTGVQVIVSAETGTVRNVKIVLIDPGAGVDGTGASASSGIPTAPDTVEPAPEGTTEPTAATTTDPAPSPPSEPTALVPSPTQAPTEDPSTAPSTPPTTEPSMGPAIEPLEDQSSAMSRAGATFTQSLYRADAPLQATNSTLKTASLTGPRVVTAAQWGAARPVCEADLASSTLSAAVHHTASTNAYTPDQVPGLLRGFQEYHMRSEASGGRGWCDIGYNFLIDKFGTIYEGRAGSLDMPVIGVHTGGFNSRTVGVSAIGNYQEASVPAVLTESISQIIAFKFAQNRIQIGRASCRERVF